MQIQTTAIGRQAEDIAAEYLKQRGFVVIHHNWRRRDYEIDLIAQKDRVMYFVEVKYRVTDQAGSGIEYITPRKLKQMAYAARRWVSKCSWHGEYALSVVEVSGEAFEVTEFIESIDT